MSEQNHDQVICPECNLQFTAIPVNVQERISDMQSRIDALDLLVSSLEEVRAKEYEYKQTRIDELTRLAKSALNSWDGGTILKANERRYRTVEAEAFDALRKALVGKGAMSNIEKHIGRMAATGTTGSLSEWCAFTDEVKRLQARIEELKAEIARERAAVCTMIDESNAFQAENERLREALKKLRDCDWVITLPDRMDAVREVARVALEDNGDA